MAGGPIHPHSTYPATAGSTFPNFYAGAGGNAAPHDEGLGVAASLGADATWELRYTLPPAIPTGVAKLLLRGLANAATGVAKITVKDAVVSPGGDPSSAALTSETQASITFAAADTYTEAKVTLTTTVVANGELVVALVFNTTGWTLAQVSTWIVPLIWE